MRWFFGNFTAGVFRFVVSWILWNWVWIVGVVAAIAAAIWGWFSRYDYLQIILAAVASFGLLLWIGIGLAWLYSRKVRYDWALAYQGLVLGLDTGNDEATLQIGVNLANVGPSALKYKIEEFRTIIEDRTIAAPIFANEGGIIPRGMVRIYRFPSFKKTTVKDMLEKRVTGTVEYVIAYGPFDSDAVRRMKMKLSVSLRLDEKFGITDTIICESDEPIDK